MPGNFALIEESPTALPFGDDRFDLIYAFSVFTHLSEPVTRAAMAVLIDALAPNGLLVLTVREVEFWRVSESLAQADVAALVAAYERTGFAFRPHTQDFGDTVISLEWFRGAFPQLEIAGYDWGMNDSDQIVVYLRPGWRFPQPGG